MYWINGQRHAALAPSDRGLQFGDGCFTTARVRDGKVDLLPGTSNVCSRRRSG